MQIKKTLTSDYYILNACSCLGSRYYNPRESVWLSVDPLATYDPIQNKEHYIDGQHNNGVFNQSNLNPYIYCYQNPVLLVDPNGKQNKAPFFSNVTREILFGLRHPIVAINVGEDEGKYSDNISSIAARFGRAGNILSLNQNGGDQGSERGAFRHATWQAIITILEGEDIAQKIGNAHEKNPNADLNIRLYKSNEYNEADQTADLLNNIIGRSIGSKSKNFKEVAGKVLEEFHNNGLWQARINSEGQWEVFKGKLSDKKYKSYSELLKTLDENGRTLEEQKDYNLHELLRESRSKW